MISNGCSFGVLAMAILGACAVPVHAQSAAPSRVTPQTAAPEVKRSDTSISLPKSNFTVAPAGSENLSVAIAAVSIEGGDAAHAAETRRLAAAVEGRTVSVAELYGVAAQIEALYARSGFILTRATVPPQDLKDGSTFRIVIVEGFIEAIDDSAVPSAVRGPVARRLAGLVNARGLTLKQIERRVLLAGRVPGVSLETTLVPGSQIGGARLVLRTQYRPLQGGLSINNRLSNAYDNFSFDAQIVANSLLGQGEQFYALGSTASDFDLVGKSPLRRVVGIGVFAPIGTNGLTLNEEYLHADTAAKPEPGALPVVGKLDRVAVKLRYPAILTRTETLNLSGGLEIVNESQAIAAFNTRISEDRLRFLTFGLEWGKAVSKHTVLGADLSFAQGLSGLGARSQADATQTGILLSRQGSRPDFSKINAALTLNQQLGHTIRADLILRGQASLSGALPSAAQFSLDGSDGLSGFSIGSINVDSGVTARLELSRAFHLNTSASAMPYIFAAVAKATLSQPSAVEFKHPDGWSIGGGLRTELGTHISLSGELARSHSNIFVKDQTRFTASVSFKF